MSKGSFPRPMSINKEQYADNWDHIFEQKKDESLLATYRCTECGMKVLQPANGHIKIQLPCPRTGHPATHVLVCP